MRIAILTLALLLGGCVTENSGVIHPEKKLTEAAVLNVQLGFEYLRAGRRADAVAKFERALEQDPDNAQASYGMALINEQVSDHKQARKFFERALSEAPDDSAIRNAYGAFLCRRGEGKAAAEAFLISAHNLNNRDPEVAYTNAGICARKVGDLVGAEQHLRDALTANPQHPPALFELADMMFARSEPLKSRAFLQRLREVTPPDARTLLLSYRTELALHDERSAARFADQLRRDFPGSPEAIQLDGKPKK